MQTTLTIDDDLAGILRRQARELDKPFKDLVNAALRKGLAEDSGEKPRTVVVRPHDFGAVRPGLELDRLNQVAAELAVEDYLRQANDSAHHRC